MRFQTLAPICPKTLISFSNTWVLSEFKSVQIGRFHNGIIYYNYSQWNLNLTNIYITKSSV